MTVAAMIALAGCSEHHAQPLGPDNPRFVKALDAAQDYAAGYYHIQRSQCGAAAGFHFGVQQDGGILIVNVKPPKPRTDAISLLIRDSDMRVIDAHPYKL